MPFIKLTLYNFFLTGFILCYSAKMSFGQDSTYQQQLVKEKLTVPFGTMVKMGIEIIDGDQLKMKGYQGRFLARVKSIDSVLLAESVVLEFKDETGKFPVNEFELHTQLYGRKTGVVSAQLSADMKKKYVAREFSVVAYETGEFTGVPDGYADYREIRQDYSFHFRNYIIIVADRTTIPTR